MTLPSLRVESSRVHFFSFCIWLSKSKLRVFQPWQHLYRGRTGKGYNVSLPQGCKDFCLGKYLKYLYGMDTFVLRCENLPQISLSRSYPSIKCMPCDSPVVLRFVLHFENLPQISLSRSCPSIKCHAIHELCHVNWIVILN